MSTVKSISLTILILFSLISCSDRKASYYQIWQEGLHLSDSWMVDFYGEESYSTESVFGVILEAIDGNWEKVEEITSGSRKSDIAAYYHNLAMAMKGCLADSLMYYYQPFERGLFLPIGDESSQLKITARSEAWYRLGEMTMAEHAAMLAQSFSPSHYGVPYLKRLAEINLVTGQEEAAKKYLRLLSKEPGCRKWVADRIPGQQSEEVKEHLKKMRSLVPTYDFVHGQSQYRDILKNLLTSNPDNQLARQYLLCFDLLMKDLSSFIQDYNPSRDRSRLYDEAVLIYLALRNEVTPQNLSHYRISQEVFKDFNDYDNLYFLSKGAMAPMQKQYGNTYWFFYQYAKRNTK